MPMETLIDEIRWEYNLTRKEAIALIKRYKRKGKYKQLCEIVKYKRSTPVFK